MTISFDAKKVPILGLTNGHEYCMRIRTMYRELYVDPIPDEVHDHVAYMSPADAATYIAANVEHKFVGIDHFPVTGHGVYDVRFDKTKMLRDGILFRVEFVSTLNPACYATVVLSAEKIDPFINDLLSSGLWDIMMVTEQENK